MQGTKDGDGSRPPLAFVIKLEEARRKRKPEQSNDLDATQRRRVEAEQKAPLAKPEFEASKGQNQLLDLAIKEPLNRANIPQAAAKLKQSILQNRRYRESPLFIGISCAEMPDAEKWQDADLVQFLSPLLELTTKENSNILPPISLCVQHQNLFCLSKELQATLQALPIIAIDFSNNPNIKWSAKNILRPTLRENDLICKIVVDDIKPDATAIEKAFHKSLYQKINARIAEYEKLAPDYSGNSGLKSDREI